MVIADKGRQKTKNTLNLAGGENALRVLVNAGDDELRVGHAYL
jgi:hypothetical protein